MDFSRPENARLINKLKTLSAVRDSKNISRAELSRLLLINKVSISEIVDSLIKEGLLKESGKMMNPSGRPSTLLDIETKAGKVISLVIRDKGCLIAASDLKGKILRLERFARGESEEETKANLTSSLERILRHESVKIYGAAIVKDSEIELTDALPFPSIEISPIEAQVMAEKRAVGDDLCDMLFIMVSEHISAYYNGLILNDFAHLPVSEEGECYCGKRGCIDASFSGDAFKRKLRANLSAKEILRGEESTSIIKESLMNLAKAISLEALAVGANRAMLIGEYAELKDEYYAILNSMIIESLPPYKGEFALYKSVAGESGMIEGASNKALDHFFYKTELLNALSKIENL